jgi:hypothetical protein
MGVDKKHNRRRQFRAAFCVDTIGELQIENRYTINVAARPK